MDTEKSDYKFEHVLGTGSFGRVHLVRKLKNKKTYVIKEQDLKGEATKTTWKMVISEVQCLKKMRHPNIIAYRRAWTEGSKMYILMEYASRGTLKDLLERCGSPLRKEDALYLFSQVTMGVHHIHSQKILHRDLKPENIMLTGRRGDIVKIGDFGVSKNVQEIVKTGGLTGSYYFMAPEILRGEPCDFKSDVWSMGAVLYWMVTSELPFQATHLAELVGAVFNSKIRPLDPGVSSEVLNLVSKMLRNDPAYRPRTDQLLFCPYLVPFVIRVHLNLGRAADSGKQRLRRRNSSKNNYLIEEFRRYFIDS